MAVLLKREKQSKAFRGERALSRPGSFSAPHGSHSTRVRVQSPKFCLLPLGTAPFQHHQNLDGRRRRQAGSLHGGHQPSRSVHSPTKTSLTYQLYKKSPPFMLLLLSEMLRSSSNRFNRIRGRIVTQQQRGRGFKGDFQGYPYPACTIRLLRGASEQSLSNTSAVLRAMEFVRLELVPPPKKLTAWAGEHQDSTACYRHFPMTLDENLYPLFFVPLNKKKYKKGCCWCVWGWLVGL